MQKPISTTAPTGHAGPSVTVLIPQYGRSHLTRRCLASFRAAHPGIPVLVIDDGSPVHDRFRRDPADPFTHVIYPTHRGVTAAWNIGLAAVRTPWVVLLNNDVVTTGPWLERLLAPLHHDSLVSGAGWQSRPFPRPPALSSITAATIPILGGWCWAFSRGLFTTLGPFDERMVHWFSDTDFQFRALQHAADRPAALTIPVLAHVPDLPLAHAGRQTTRYLEDRSPQHTADRETFFRKWSTPAP